MPRKPTVPGNKKNMFTPEQVDMGLIAYIVYNGNTRNAAKALKDEGITIHESTLRTWVRSTHTGRFLELREAELPRIKAQLAGKLEAIADKAATAQDQALDRFIKEMPDMDIKDVIKGLQSSGIVGGIGVQRSSELRGESNLIIEHKNPAEIIKKLERMGVIETTAEEIEESPALGEAS